jgi:aspartate aminotransferase
VKLSNRVANLKPSPTLMLAAKAKELAATGHQVVSLAVGEPDWDTFQVAKRGGIEAIEKGQTKYSPSNGIPELRKAIAERTTAEIGITYSAEHVTVTSGGKFVIFSALQALINPGDEVIIPGPYWVSYPTMVELAEGVPVCVPCDQTDGFKLTPENLRRHLRPKTRLLILNSPSNPTGVMYSEDELLALAKVLRDFPNVMILSDDIYNRLVFEKSVAPHILHVAPDLVGRTLVMNGAAKTYSMTGWRVGWALGPLPWIQGMTNYQSQTTSCAPTMAQVATLKAIQEGEPELKEALTELKRRRDFVVGLLSNIPGVVPNTPDGAFYVWPSIKAHLGKKWNGKTLTTSSDFSAALLEDQKVVVVPGIEFGLDGYVRISYALKDSQMKLAADRIRAFVQVLL